MKKCIAASLRVGQRRRCSSTAPTASAVQAKAAIEAFFASSEKWSDPWTPCLTDHPPSPFEVAGAASWEAAGSAVADACDALLMTEARFKEVMAVRSSIEDVLKKEMGEPGLSLFTFGSCMSGLGTQTSDLDLVIIRYDETGRSLNPGTREEQLGHFEDYQAMLRRHGFDHLRLIQARVPILRQESPSGVSFDISLFFHGVRNSVLLREYTRSCPFFLPMSLVLREWAKHVGICNSLGGYLTPYCLNVMLIKYLVQVVSKSFFVPVPPILPPVYYPTYPSQYLPPPRELQRREPLFVHDLGLHVAGFLRFYACFPWIERVVSASDPINDSRQENPLWSEPSTQDIAKTDVVIEEMFAQQDMSLPIPNMGHKVDAMRLLSIREKLMYSYFHMVKHGYLPADPEDTRSAPWKPGIGGGNSKGYVFQ